MCNGHAGVVSTRGVGVERSCVGLQPVALGQHLGRVLKRDVEGDRVLDFLADGLVALAQRRQRVFVKPEFRDDNRFHHSPLPFLPRVCIVQVMSHDDTEWRSVGVNLPEGLVDDLDDLKRARDAESLDSVSRSQVAREALDVGLVALQLIDEEYDQDFRARGRREIIREALQQFFRRDRSE